MNLLELHADLCDQVAQLAGSITTFEAAYTASDPEQRAISRQVLDCCRRAERAIQDAGDAVRLLARVAGNPYAFECYTVAKAGEHLDSYMGFGSRVLYANTHTGYAVVGMLRDHHQWQRGRLGSGLMGGWKLYDTYNDALAAANDQYGGA